MYDKCTDKQVLTEYNNRMILDFCGGVEILDLLVDDICEDDGGLWVLTEGKEWRFDSI